MHSAAGHVIPEGVLRRYVEQVEQFDVFRLLVCRWTPYGGFDAVSHTLHLDWLRTVLRESLAAARASRGRGLRIDAADSGERWLVARLAVETTFVGMFWAPRFASRDNGNEVLCSSAFLPPCKVGGVGPGVLVGGILAILWLSRRSAASLVHLCFRRQRRHGHVLWLRGLGS